MQCNDHSEKEEDIFKLPNLTESLDGLLTNRGNEGFSGKGDTNDLREFGTDELKINSTQPPLCFDAERFPFFNTIDVDHNAPETSWTLLD